MNDVLFFYQCPGCKSTAVSVVEYARSPRDKERSPLCCILCNRYMHHKWDIHVVTPQQREWADRGLVFNPGQQ
jgi:hypothetical protein